MAGARAMSTDNGVRPGHAGPDRSPVSRPRTGVSCCRWRSSTTSLRWSSSALTYTSALSVVPLAVALGIFMVILTLRQARIRTGIVYALLGIAAWVAVLKSGIDPVVVGLVRGC